MSTQFLPDPTETLDDLLAAWGGEILSDCWLPGDAAHPATAIRFALLHHAHGVALIDLAPDQVPDAVARFRRRYRALQPQAPEVPPVVYRSLPAQDLWRLTVLLDSAFAGEPALGRRDGAWMEMARRVLTQDAPAAPVTGPARPVVPAQLVQSAGPMAAIPVPARAEPAIDEPVLSELAIPEPPLAGHARHEPALPAPGPGPAPARRALPWLVGLLTIAGGAAALHQLGLVEGWLSAGTRFSAAGPGADHGAVAPRVAAEAGAPEVPSAPAGLQDGTGPAIPAGDSPALAAEAPESRMAALPAGDLPSEPSPGVRGTAPDSGEFVPAELPPEPGEERATPADSPIAAPGETLPGPSEAVEHSPTPDEPSQGAGQEVAAAPIPAEPEEREADPTIPAPFAAMSPDAPSQPLPEEASAPVAEAGEVRTAVPDGRLDAVSEISPSPAPPEAGLSQVAPPDMSTDPVHDPEAILLAPGPLPTAEAPATGPTPVTVETGSPESGAADTPGPATPPEPQPVPASAEPSAVPAPETVTAEALLPAEEATEAAPVPSRELAEAGPSPPSATAAITTSPTPSDPIEAAPQFPVASLQEPAAATGPAAEDSLPPAGTEPQPSSAGPALAMAPVAPPVSAPVEVPPLQVPAAGPSPATEAPLPSMAPELLQALVRRGDAMLAIGDVSAARLLYERAADAGSGPAATAMGRSYDPAALAMLGVRGLRPDPEAAAFWYRRAMALGDPEAGPLARHLAGRNQERGPARRAE